MSHGSKVVPSIPTRMMKSRSALSVANDRPWRVQFDELATLLPSEGDQVERPKSESFDAEPFTEVLRNYEGKIYEYPEPIVPKQAPIEPAAQMISDF